MKMHNDRKSASVWTVTDVPLQLGYPNGFSSRYLHFLEAVASRWPLDIIALRQDNPAEWDAKPFLRPQFPVCHFWPEFVPPTSLAGPGVQGELRRVAHYIFDPKPYMSHPRRLPGLKEHWKEHPPQLVLLFLPYTAHFSFQLPASVPCIYVLEEGMERSLDWGLRAMSRFKRSLIGTTEWARVRRMYRQLAERGNPIVVISDDEKKWFSKMIPEERITVLPHGLDCEHFQPMSVGPVEQDVDVAFFGHMAHNRNYEPALNFYKSFEALQPDSFARLKWAFVGKSPHDSIRALESPQVLVTDMVPDLRPYYARTKVVVIPTTFGTGVKTTVMEAWAMGRPIVATSFALNGLPARAGENVLVGDSPEELARHVATLLGSPKLREQIGQAGLQTVRAERDIRVIADRFANLCAETLHVRQSS